MRLVRLKVRNFKKLGREGEVSVDFPDEGIVAVVGENEAGKSTLADAILYALTGKTKGMIERSREAQERAGEEISWGAREARVELEFRVGDARFKVVRRRSANRPDARLLGGRDAQGWENVSSIVSEMMSGMDAKTLAVTVFSAQKDTGRPTKLDKEERKRVISRLLGLDPWSRSKERLVEKRRRLDSDKDSLEAKINELRVKIEGLEEAEKQLDEKRKKLEEVERELKEIPDKEKELREEEKFLSGKKREVEELGKKKNDIERRIGELNTQIEEKEKRRGELMEEIENLKKKAEEKRSVVDSKRRERREYERRAGVYERGARVAFIPGLAILLAGLLAGLTSPLGAALIIFGGLMAVVGPAIAIRMAASMRREAERIGKDIGILEREEIDWRDKESALREVEGELNELKAEKEEKVSSLKEIEAKIEGIREEAGGDPEKLLGKVREELAKLEVMKENLEKDKRELEDEIAEKEEEVKKLEALRSELKQKEDEVKKLEEMIGVINLATSMVNDVVETVWRSVAPSIEANMGKFLERITLGRYYKVRVGEEDWSVEVYVPERASAGQDPYVSVFRLSGGTQDQVMLALRLAVITSLVGRGASWPEFLILDEVLGATDERRREGVMELLKSLRRQFPQIIVITHQEDVAEMADVVVRVEDGRVEVQNMAGASDGSEHA